MSILQSAFPPTLALTSDETLVDAAAVAKHLSVERGWVYEHAGELGAIRLGSGPRARLRFSLQDVDAALTACSSGGRSNPADAAPAQRSRPSRSRATGTKVVLLPIRGREGRL